MLDICRKTITNERVAFRPFSLEPVFDVKKENERLQKWMEMLRNWDVYVVESFHEE